MIAQAERMLEDDRLGDAYRFVVLAEIIGGDDDKMRANIKSVGEKVKEAADGLIEQAAVAESEGRYAEAIDGYAAVAGLRKMTVSKTALRKLSELRRNPAARANMREVEAMQRLDRVLERVDPVVLGVEVVIEEPHDSGAEACDPDVGTTAQPDSIFAGSETGDEVASSDEELCPVDPETEAMELTELDFALLLNLCDRIKFIDDLDAVGERYSETPAGQRAQQLAADLRASEAFMDGLEEHRLEEKAMECISMAQQYEQAGMLEMALEQYREAAEASPDSEWGEAAKAALAKLDPE